MFKWGYLEELLGDTAYQALVNTYQNSNDWSIINKADAAGSEYGLWLFKRNSNRISIGIMAYGDRIYHIKRTIDAVWHAKLISK